MTAQNPHTLKVLVLSHTSDLKGGAERSMLDVFDYWASRYGIEPEFILREPLGSMVAEMNKRGWKYHALKYTFWSWPTLPSRPQDLLHHARENAAAVAGIEKVINQLKPDVFITNTIISPWGALAAYFQKTPHVWFVREYGDLDHGRQFDMSHKNIYEDVGNLSNLVVGNSETISKHIAGFMPKAKVATLYTPFDIKKLRAATKAKIKNPFKYADSLKLVMTSNLAPSKGHLEAVEATGKLNKAGHLTELCLVGHTEHTLPAYMEKIYAAIEHYGIGDKVHIVGLQKEPLAYVALADVGIVASRKEAFGRTTFEYLAIGKPTVGANSGATPEMVKPGVSGYLFKPGDSTDLAKAIQHYIDNPKLLAEHGKSAEKLAVQMMAGPHNIEAIYKKLELVAAGKGSPKGQPIHYLEQWPGYNQQTHQLVKAAALAPIKHRLRWRTRQFAKNNYYRVRKIKAKITGH